MNKLREQRQTLQDLEELIRKMDKEIDLLRNIVLRYYLKHGRSVEDGEVIVPDFISFDVRESDGDVSCRRLDYGALALESTYQKIKKAIKELE